MLEFSQSLLCRKIHEFDVMLNDLCTALYFVSHAFTVSAIILPLYKLVVYIALFYRA